MSPLAAFDATRICSRVSAEPDAWARPIPTRERTAVTMTPFSWLAMARNPNAMVVSALVGAIVARDAVVRAVAGSARIA